MAICDDCKKDIKIVEEYVIEYMEEKNLPYTINKFGSGEELLECKLEFDLVFLDITMGEGINGIVAGKEFQKLHRQTKIVYITSFRQYCEMAINRVHAFAYLKKPLRKEILNSQMGEILCQIEEERRDIKLITFEVFEMIKEYQKEVIIKEFKVDEILYFEYANRKVRMVTIDGEFYFRGQMKKLIDKMSEYTFESCHQSYLVNLKYVRKIKNYELYLKNGEQIPVSQKKSFEFRKKLNKFVHENI